jgi:hypothetical protein
MMTISVRSLGCPVFSFSTAYEGDTMHGWALVFEPPWIYEAQSDA